MQVLIYLLFNVYQLIHYFIVIKLGGLRPTRTPVESRSAPVSVVAINVRLNMLVYKQVC